MGEDFDWQKILEENKLLDEEEYNHYLFRKERLNQFRQEHQDEQENKLKGPASMKG